MIKVFFTLLLLIFIQVNVYATWSIMLIDPVTKEIGIAGASCSYNCYGIGEIEPGKGAIIVQAMSNSEARAYGMKLLISNKTPEEIIEALKIGKFDPNNQQYAVVDLNSLKVATFTGSSTSAFNGSITGKGLSIQGNILATNNVLNKIYEAAIDGQKKSLPIHKILMMALEAGSEAGGDKRCGEQKATSAFITVMKPHDSKRKPYLNLKIFGQPQGGPNAVDLLKMKYNNWLLKNNVE